MKTDDGLFADFYCSHIIGGGLRNHHYYFGSDFPVPYAHERDLKFATSWDWLMPVVEKAIKWWQNQEGDLRHEAERKLQHVLPTLWMMDISFSYSQMADFLKWYNENKNV